MESQMEVTKEQEIGQIKMGKPHVVILGAGASYAAFPNGDRNGKKLPLMNTLVNTLGLDDILKSSGINFHSANFEDIYDQLYKSKQHDELIAILENKIYAYFSSLEILDEPTIYDYLLLSLREKDIVATFNWDPFLFQSYRRNAKRFKLPKLLFLHGNVEVGCCTKDKIVGVNGNKCSRCGNVLTPTKLLYPIAEKNYHLDGFISSQWQELSNYLKEAFMITIFGYGAPKSDISSVNLLKSAWGDVNQRSLEQTELIDIRTEDDLRKTWEPFIHTHHCEIHSSFYDSWIANHPRRTGEAYINQYFEVKFIENNPIPKKLSFLDLWVWLTPLKEAESQHA
jgi:hypothetical protein